MPLLGPDGEPLSQTPPPAAPENAEEPKTPKPVEVATAFLVAIMPNGLVSVSKNINAPIIPAREAHDDEVKGACHTLASKQAVQETVNFTTQNVVGSIMQNLVQVLPQVLSQAIQDAALNTQVRTDLAQGRH